MPTPLTAAQVAKLRGMYPSLTSAGPPQAHAGPPVPPPPLVDQPPLAPVVAPMAMTALQHDEDTGASDVGPPITEIGNVQVTASPPSASPVPAPSAKSLLDRGYPPEIVAELKAIELAKGEQAGASTKAALAEAEAQESIATLTERTAQVVERARLAQEKNEAERTEAARAADAKQQKLEEDFAKAAVIDPNHAWESKSTGGKVLAVLGVALSGIGSAIQATAGIPQGPNEAAAMLEREAERDIAVQRANVLFRKDVAERGRGLYAQALELHRDERQAEASAMAARLHSLKMQVASAASLAGSTVAKERATGITAALDESIAGWRMQVKQGAYNAIAARQAAQANAAAAAQAARMKDPVFLANTAKAAEVSRQYRGSAKVIYDQAGQPVAVSLDAQGKPLEILWSAVAEAPGAKQAAATAEHVVQVPTAFNDRGDPTAFKDTVAASKKDAEALRDEIEAAVGVRQGAEELIALRTSHKGGAVWGGSERAKGQAISSRIKARALRLEGATSRTGKYLFEALTNLVPEDPLQYDWFQEPTMARLHELKRHADTSLRAALAARSATPAPALATTAPPETPDE